MSDSQRHRVRELTAREAVLTETIRELRDDYKVAVDEIEQLQATGDRLQEEIGRLQKLLSDMADDPWGLGYLRAKAEVDRRLEK